MNPELIRLGLQFAASIPQMVQAGVDIAEAFSSGAALTKRIKEENRAPTQAEWDSIDLAIDGNLAELNALAGQ